MTPELGNRGDECGPDGVSHSFNGEAAPRPWTVAIADDRRFIAHLDLLKLGRLWRAEEIAGAIRHLASPDTGFVHATCLEIDGGFTAR
jgi:3-oxoacyl-[acyl-carrier protein] reductase